MADRISQESKTKVTREYLTGNSQNRLALETKSLEGSEPVVANMTISFSASNILCYCNVSYVSSIK